MSTIARICAGLLLALPAAAGVAAEPLSQSAAPQPEFLTLARSAATSADPAANAPLPIKPFLTASTAPVGTQTVAQRQADGRVRIHCREVSLRAVPLQPRHPEQVP